MSAEAWLIEVQQGEQPWRPLPYWRVAPTRETAEWPLKNNEIWPFTNYMGEQVIYRVARYERVEEPADA